MAVRKTCMLVLDCAEPVELAEFYARLLDAKPEVRTDPDLVEVVGDHGAHIGLRRERGYAPPSWPRPEDSLHTHLRLLVDREDMDEAEREAVDLGARPVETRSAGTPHEVRVFSDPAGHSFTIAATPAEEYRPG